MIHVTPKKYLGQHFLKDKNIAKKIVESLELKGEKKVLEIGPGTGILTEFLLKNKEAETWVIEIDKESIAFLREKFPELKNQIIEGDFLKTNLEQMQEPFAIIGNLPYYISSQIFFKIMESPVKVTRMVCMIQKEVAERIASPPGTKSRGILSVLLQAHYDIQYLFTVSENVFDPPPNVKSAVIKLTRNDRKSLGCNEILFKKIVKTSFNQRRKTIKNSLKSILLNLHIESELLSRRPEQLSVEEFISLTNLVENHIH